MEEQGEPDRLTSFFRNQAFSIRPEAEQVVAEPGLVQHNGVRQLLVLGQFPDQGGDGRHVGRGGTSNHFDPPAVRLTR